MKKPPNPLPLNRDSGNSELQRAADFLACGRPQQALEILEAALKGDRGNARLYNMAGDCAIIAGDQARAERYWRQTVRLNPSAATPHFNLGLLYARSHLDEQAKAFYQKAIALDPGNVAAYNNLGLLWERLQRPDDAEQCYRQAVSINPNYSEALTNLGVLLASRRQEGEAEQCCRRAIAANPGNAEALANLAAILASRKCYEEAERCYVEAITLNPGNSKTYSNLGILLADQKRYAEAEHCYRRAISLDAGNAEAYSNLGLVLEQGTREEEAERRQRIALQLNENSAQIHSNLANLISNRKGSAAEAEIHYLKAVALSPDSAYVYSNYAVFLTNQKRYELAEQYFRQALAIDATYPLARLNLGFLLLSEGRFAEGWLHHESRYDPRLPGNGVSLAKLPGSQVPVPELPFPEWRGEPLDGKALLVWQEQGFGDEIQFCRYLPRLKKQWRLRITYVCKTPLKHVMDTLEDVDEVLALSEVSEIHEHDYWTVPLSIPFYFQPYMSEIPGRLPYLEASSQRIAFWKPRLPDNGFRVGLMWRGNPHHHNDIERSLPDISVLDPLRKIPGVCCISLQKGVAVADNDLPICSLGQDITDFADTAAILAQVDLFITVDTAAAHLAGALGKTCWVLLPAYRADWRWLHDRSDSPWYPGVMRLFRQSDRGDWSPVIEEVRKALIAFMNGRP